MKKFILLLTAVFGMVAMAISHPVSQEMAKMVAARFMKTNDLHLVSAYKTDKNVTAFYIFNTTDGFVIVSADDCETPIIGYSREGRFDPNDIPIQMQGYLQYIAEMIQYYIESQIVADAETMKQWTLVKTVGRLNESKNAKSVTPLLTDHWHQGCLYNSFCPEMDGPCGRAEVGCVAVAMGQIMHYWGYPAKGWGSNSYTNLGTTLSADFGSTTYDWSHMPDSLTESSSEAEIEAIGSLLFHCGVAVNMRYSNNGSVTNTEKAVNALMQFFDYSRQIQQVRRANYDDEAWSLLLKEQLDQQRPVLYSGFTGQGWAGHSFVCDGYDANGLFHFNWGWSGTANGYFAIGNLNPNGNNFNNSNSIIIDIIPQYDPCIVSAMANPSGAGVIEGDGEYHIGEQCTLTATPADNAKFKYWLKDGSIVSRTPIYRFKVAKDVDNLEAVFTFLDIEQIAAELVPNANDSSAAYLNLTWEYCNSKWDLLEQFQIDEHKGVATDGEFIYTYGKPYSSDSLLHEYAKYNMEGELIEQFDIEGVFADGMAYDGQYFYCSNDNETFNIRQLYRLDFDNKVLIDSIDMHQQFYLCAYDTAYDAFWLFNPFLSSSRLTLVNRQGEIIIYGPTLSQSTSIMAEGLGCITAQDGNRHVLMINANGSVADYDIENDKFNNYYTLEDVQGFISSGFIGKYERKNALFLIVNHYPIGSFVYIFEIKNQLAQIIGFNIYRSDNEHNTTKLIEGANGSSYTDSTWAELNPGLYRYGISSVFANGTESEIIWSDYIEKTGFGIGENGSDTTIPTAQKVFEDGQIVLIKDGKRYTVTGQELR